MSTVLVVVGEIRTSLRELIENMKSLKDNYGNLIIVTLQQGKSIDDCAEWIAQRASHEEIVYRLGLLDFELDGIVSLQQPDIELAESVLASLENYEDEVCREMKKTYHQRFPYKGKPDEVQNALYANKLKGDKIAATPVYDWIGKMRKTLDAERGM